MKNVEAILTACTSRKLLKKNIEKSKIREDYYEYVNSIFIWWYRPVPAIRTFLTRNDLSGKTIKPYATNAGWLGRTFKEIEKLCPNSNVEQGMNIVEILIK